MCEWGLSIFTEFRGRKILFDAGGSAAIFAKNVKAFSVDLTKVDMAVLSHDHWDHSCGFSHLVEVNPQVQLYMPDDIALGGEEHQEHKKKYRIGYRYPHIATDLIPESAEIEKGIHLIVTRSVLTGVFSKYPKSWADPEKFKGIPELSLALEGEDGSITILVGCSHSGIENILKAAKSYFKRNINRVVGGMHLLPYDEKYIKDIVAQMRDAYGVRFVHASHCTGEVAQKLFQESFGENYAAFGLGERFVY